MKKMVIGTLLGLSSMASLAGAGRLGGELLLGKTDQEINSEFGGAEGDDTAFGLRGTWRVHSNLALEASYLDYGEATVNYTNIFGDTIRDVIDSRSVNFGVKGILPVEGGFSLYAGIGVAFWDVEMEKTDSFFPGKTFTGDDSGNDLYYSIGIQQSTKSNFFVSAEYRVSEFGVNPDDALQDLDIVDVDVKTFILAVGLTF